MNGQDAQVPALGNATEIPAPGLVGMLHYFVLLSGRSQVGTTRERDREQGK